MSLIGSLVDKLLKTGSITLIRPGHEPTKYGHGGKHLTVRFTDRKVAFDILRNPRLAVGEAYMDGRLIVEDGTILDLLELIVGSNRWEDGGSSRKAIKRGKRRLKWLFSRNRAARYHTALGSARETMACLEVAVAMGYLDIADPKVLDALARIVGTLVRLVQRHA